MRVNAHATHYSNKVLTKNGTMKNYRGGGERQKARGQNIEKVNKMKIQLPTGKRRKSEKILTTSRFANHCHSTNGLWGHHNRPMGVTDCPRSSHERDYSLVYTQSLSIKPLVETPSSRSSGQKGSKEFKKNKSNFEHDPLTTSSTRRRLQSKVEYKNCVTL